MNKFRKQAFTMEGPGFQALFAHASIGIVVIDDKGRITLVNDFLLDQFEYKKEELLGKEIELLIPSRFKDAHISHRKKFNGHPQTRPMGMGVDLYGLKKSGKEFPVEVSLAHYRSKNKNYSVAYISDISTRKQAENLMKQLNSELEEKIAERTGILTETVIELGEQIKEVEAKDQELQKVNGYLKNIWNHAGAILIATNPDGIIEWFNPLAEKRLGYSAEEVEGKQTPVIFHDPQETENHAKKLTAFLQREIEPGFETFVARARLDLPNEFECTYLRKNGSSFPVTLNVTALRDQENNITGFLGIAIDISDRKKAEADLLSALRKEKELNELKSRFVSIASHEFRTPLSTILSSTYLITQYQEKEDQPKRKKHTERIISSVNLLTDILNDFLSVGKIEEGRVLVNTKVFNLKNHIESVLRELEGLRKDGQQVIYQHSGEEDIESDPSILRHILFNLVTNAIKFSSENSPIKISTAIDQDLCILSVKDKGIGIPEKDKEHLFDLFYRGSNVSNIQGTGLGLHIIKRYTELLNGNITCDSEFGEGTEFKISLHSKSPFI